MTSTQLRLTDREVIADRLLLSSAKLSLDPLTDIDWDRPADASRYAMPPHRVSLYGTALWDRLTEEQRKELSRQEVASLASLGIWFEAILMQMLIRHAYDRDPTSSHIQYAYTEIADECRHSVMFARFMGKMGFTHHRLPLWVHHLGRFLKTTSNGQLTFCATLFVEELLDQAQREAMVDETIDPLTQAVARLHVTEEARHMRYAREELIRDWQSRGAFSRAYSRLILALTAAICTRYFVHPSCYARVGLDPREARRVALRNEHYRATKAWMSRQAVETFTAAGLIAGLSERIWRHAGLLYAEGQPG